jgi:rhodanese-related sulfurtransferase
MKTKPLTFLLALTFLFLFSGSVYGQEEVKKEYWDNGKLKSETHYKDGKPNGLETDWSKDGNKIFEATNKNGTNLISTTQRISAATIDELKGETTIVDIRSEKEWEGEHIKDSINIPLNSLADRIVEIPESGHVIVHCQGGYRSMIAASLLEKEGRSNVFDLAGGYQAWVTTKRSIAASVNQIKN